MRILYQDAHMLVCEKPAGLLSQRDAAGGDSLVSQLEQTVGPVWPVHRLDRETGGVMVFARTAKAAAALSESVRQNRLEKEYLAVLPGALEPREGELEDLLFHDRVRNRSYVVDRVRKGAKSAKLAYRVLEERPESALVAVRLYTGRTHQIRVQFASRQLPLLGDLRYGSRKKGCGLALWAWHLRVPHPVDGRMVTAAVLPPVGELPWNEFLPESYPGSGEDQ